VARPQIRIGGRSYDLVNYLRGGAAGVQAEAERAVRLMTDCATYLSEDDGFGLGDTPKHAVSVLERALSEAKRLVRDTDKARAHLLRKVEKTNPKRRR
jgi:hypothetical protein